jgi:hypothetical protein
MNRWADVRTALLIAGAALSIFAGPVREHATPPMDIRSIAIITFGSLIGVIFVVGLQSLNKHSAGIWTKPSWKTNPFSLKQPLQFFHFAAYFLIISGAISFVLTYLDDSSFIYDAAVIPVAGIGSLLGVWLSRIIFAFKFRASSGDANQFG